MADWCKSWKEAGGENYAASLKKCDENHHDQAGFSAIIALWVWSLESFSAGSRGSDCSSYKFKGGERRLHIVICVSCLLALVRCSWQQSDYPAHGLARIFVRIYWGGILRMACGKLWIVCIGRPSVIEEMCHSLVSSVSSFSFFEESFRVKFFLRQLVW